MNPFEYLLANRVIPAPDSTSGHFLSNASGTVCVPAVRDFLFFNEADLNFGASNHRQLEALASTLAEKRKAYELFVRRKGRRAHGDIYASYQPFNEASKAFYPFVAALRERLQPGDLIVNLWDRGAWFTGLLPALFPEQKVVTTWEGDKNVLGYGGYDFWFAGQYDPEKFQILFCDPNRPLPFASESVALLFAIDAFHRFDQSLWMQEALRVVQPEGAIVFPHTHLTNNEPEPFFERGCKQMHGADYQYFFDRIHESTGRKGYVLSEPALFWLNDMEKGGQMPLKSTPAMADYNGTLAILPPSWETAVLQPLDYRALGNSHRERFLILNGLFTIDFAHQHIRRDRSKFDGAVGKLLDRHPIYVKRTLASDGVQLSDLETRILYLAQHLYSIEEIAARLHTDLATMLQSVDRFVQLDIALALPVSRAHARLQHFLSHQQYVLPEDEQTLPSLWNRAIREYAERPLLISQEDESTFTYADGGEIVNRLAYRLQQAEVNKGDRVVLLGPLQSEMALIFWACAQMGAVAVPLVAEKGDATIQAILDETEPRLIFTDAGCLSLLPESYIWPTEVVLFDTFENEPTETYTFFSDWLEEVDTSTDPEKPFIEPKDIGAILYTSGSTGHPKGVLLDHGSLFRSARLITESFGWETTDRYLAIAGIDSMSGLRNACLAPLEVGAAILLPGEKSKKTAFGIAEAAADMQATLLAATPPLFRQLLDFQQRTKGLLSSIRLTMCTGSYLSDTLKRAFADTFGLELYNYYGLTETSGICLGQTPNGSHPSMGNIGFPIGAIAQVVDERHQILPLDTPGELRIFTLNLTPGYWQAPEKIQESIHDGWYYTGDLAVCHADGSFSLQGRKKEIVKISSGELVHPLEIELCLERMAGIKAAAVCTYLDRDTEKIAAFVVPEVWSLTKETVLEDLRSQLGPRKTPNILLFVEDLPRNSNGKVIKTQLIALIETSTEI